ncbi:LysR substrate binding domain-containing protein [Xenorhabdus cabanillasii]|uniref:LysR substrate binding domain-containing protein n=2 Tax=Xenorhabdus cabanillasii TaxID=351673 RepID=A0A3D9UNX9_9GAMM|nr:LysR substrate binding domain-containing protein [Xenorhabdus cabanillasii]
MELFRQTFPEITLYIHTSDTIISLEENNIDIAIRYGDTPDEQMTSYLLSEDSFTVVASPQLKINSLDDLLNFPLIHVKERRFPKYPVDWEKWRSIFGPSSLNVDEGVHFTDEVHAMQYVIAGQGVFISSRVIADDAINNGLLYQPLEQKLTGCRYYFIENKTGVKKEIITHFRKWLIEQIQLSKKQYITDNEF